MEEKKQEGFLGHGVMDVRYGVPKGKYRVVLLDFWSYSATVIGDFDTLEEARSHVFGGDSYEDYVIYDDTGAMVYDLDNYDPTRSND